MGIFGDLDLKNANEDPFYKPDDTYLCLITGAPIATSRNNPNNQGMTILYDVQEGNHLGETIREWKSVPFEWQVDGYATEEDWKNQTNFDPKVAKNAKTAIGFLKRRMMDFGFSPEEMDNIEQKDIIQVGYVYVTIKHDDKKNEKVTGVKVADMDSVGNVEGESSSPFELS